MTYAQFVAKTTDDRYIAALTSFLCQAADDELVMGHRESEWLGMAPEIEEDVAFGSISQDEVGHAVYYYNLVSGLTGEPVELLAYERPHDVRRNAVLVERGNGDWAYTVVRHFFYDEFDHLRLTALTHSSYEPLRQGAAKMLREEYYHRLHAQTWFTRLAQAGGEAKERIERAIATQWPDLPELFMFGEAEQDLLANGIISLSGREVREAWFENVSRVMRGAGLIVPPAPWLGEQNGGSEARAVHTDALKELLGTLSEVYDLDKTAVW
ncbi:1,2-phenylacetyl-CoA epoxidase subunit PaaC [Alicyclobacillus sp. ALC3]|uniref:1,2-phenylacetyl-CoA epoxidase subunit PaaC n=1 Tax=Alicyclobacillus sp. ALC3 TaxID=2796143 RepID=UPI0023794EE4|nr:1,2-phenylacetyl-CoA epoxidase subunit PaaC [Alicyclobacillus sp. ALC3]WDL96221.1 phenylacetate-CoA oxygenase subunit PaaC [Alicyclobacillus sp. ALC3]